MNIKSLLKQMSNQMSVFAGIGTWSMVFGISLYWLQHASDEYKNNSVFITLLFIVYLACFILITRKHSIQKSHRLIYSVLTVQLLSAFILLWFLPISFLPILTIIWVSILPHYFSVARSMLIMLAVVTGWFSLYAFRWQESMFLSALLYGSFHFFAVLMMHHVRVAEDATAEAQCLNTELLATRQLLAEASRQTERTRIARDLHDLLGHHLTALIINLQVAGHISEGEAKSKIEQCHSLAKLLLSDVREAVTALRENQSLDFHKMIELMIANIPNMKINTNIDAQLNLENLNLAKSLLSCIQEALTNSLRHSGANEFWITMTEIDNTLQLELVDNGQIQGEIIKGNGLTGMTERIADLGGQLQVDKVQNSLRLNIKIPLFINAELSSSASAEFEEAMQ